ncbi:hypothetical protein HYFRA_00008470 [Hymenoscyphus fraxineus]|uniref:Uncharacterized protein n=1 Tax=Hymenoscyphus fraxineus TaxID=746836 RepID=A0A9N9KRH5_9HELO|nr:hypothetical protein HYFRA_00008470 [Hymenoscyphus fraxineus]
MKSPNSLARFRAQNARSAVNSRARKHDFLQSLLEHQDKLHDFASAQYLEFQSALALIRAIHDTPEIASILAEQQHSSIQRQIAKFALQCPGRVPRKLVRRRHKTGKKGRPTMEAMELDEGEESGPVETSFNGLPAVPLQAIHQSPTASTQYKYPLSPQHAVHSVNSAIKQIPHAQSATTTEQPRHQQVVHPVLPTLHQTFSPHAVIATGKPENNNQALSSRVLKINNLLNLEIVAANEPSQCPPQELHPAIPVVVNSPSPRPTAIMEKSQNLQQKGPQRECVQQEIHSTVSRVQTPKQRTPPFSFQPTLRRTTASNADQPPHLGDTRRKMLESDVPVLFDERMYDAYDVGIDPIRLGWNYFNESQSRNLDPLVNERNSTPQGWFSPLASPPGIFL